MVREGFFLGGRFSVSALACLRDKVEDVHGGSCVQLPRYLTDQILVQLSRRTCLGIDRTVEGERWARCEVSTH